MPERHIRRAYVDVGAGQIHYLTAGDEGEPLVLCHQSPNCSRMFSAVLPRLAEAGYRVYAFDTPGHGESTPPSSDPQITDYAGTFLQATRTLGLDRFHLLGHHTGAAIACELALQAGDAVCALVLNGTPLFSEEVRAARREGTGLRITPVADGSHLADIWELRKRVTPGWTRLDVMHRAVIDLLRSGQCSHQGHAAVYRYDLHSALLALAVPTLILTNTGEDLYQHSLAAQALRPAGFELTVLDGGTHDIVDEQPVEWAAAVVDFLDRYPAAAS